MLTAQPLCDKSSLCLTNKTLNLINYQNITEKLEMYCSFRTSVLDGRFEHFLRLVS